MADSIRELILKDLKESLERIRVSNGYQTDIDNVQRWEMEGNERRNTPCIIIVPDEEGKERGPDPYVTCRMGVFLELWFRHDKEQNACPTDELVNIYMADIEKAIFSANASGVPGHLRGGKAIDTYVEGSQGYETTQGQPFVVLVLRIEILYQHLHNDPYQ